MVRITELRMPLEHDEAALQEAVAQRLGAAPLAVQVVRRGYDARRRSRIVLVYTVDVAVAEPEVVLARLAGDRNVGAAPDTEYRWVTRASAGLDERPVVIGAGPCGLMAALVLAQRGFRPIVLERGKVVRERTQDTWGFWRRSVLQPESNVQFGEGGAGTFSDGKLWSGISDPAHHRRKLLEEFVAAGAPEEILWNSKPHIGTFRLVTVVEGIRAQIERLGGSYRFGARVEDLLLEPEGIVGVRLAGGEEIRTRRVILAIGHSARDTMAMLAGRGVAMVAKPLSIGVRIEHPQALIDRARFGDQAGHERLGAADYKLVHHCATAEAAGRSVYSFCMCPGGTVVAAASEPGRLVTNGMSQYSRAERNANAGIVVGLNEADFRPFGSGPLAGIAFQRHWEERAFVAGGADYCAPAQRVGDFLAGRASISLGDVTPSYRPGVRPADLADCLPDYAVAAIREALPAFARRIEGFAMEDAVMTGVETRTSSPVRIVRGEDGQNPAVAGLYPAGEGAGFAGGIMSAGVDGIKAAERVALAMSACAVPAL